MTTTIKIDEENNADFFWSRISRGAGHCPIPRFGAWLKSHPLASITLDKDEAAVVTSWLAEQPGWTDPEYPSYAPHPLCVE